MVLELAVSSTSGCRSELANQVSLIRNRFRTFTESGVVTRFAFEDRIEKLKGQQNFHLGNVNGITSSLLFGFGSALFIRGGLITSLEFYTYGEVWPSEFTDVKLELDDAGFAGESK
ncbi:hypothetical protein [Sphingomonas sp. S-NIH.Pt15_0812]|uniref:hypothetical protein n=1 Tax=Sphingomonas sp. S-NIH.Pt15_0812 TaxID=1920129 RepID=UPI000F7F5016|nr:hypothetical protein [Sphingomonas sp. S-NIH.Pt15_0812]